LPKFGKRQKYEIAPCDSVAKAQKITRAPHRRSCEPAGLTRPVHPKEYKCSTFNSFY
jgi:hypothetical protein